MTLFTDHKPLVSAFYKSSLLKSDKQQRQLSLVTEYVADFLYIRGDQNVVADCLLKPSINAAPLEFFFH